MLCKYRELSSGLEENPLALPHFAAQYNNCRLKNHYKNVTQPVPFYLHEKMPRNEKCEILKALRHC